MHAKGAGAHGTFTVTHDICRYIKAKLFAEVGKQTPMFARFSTVAGERGAPDAERDVRGFAVKFYTEEGNWDVVGARYCSTIRRGKSAEQPSTRLPMAWIHVIRRFIRNQFGGCCNSREMVHVQPNSRGRLHRVQPLLGGSRKHANRCRSSPIKFHRRG